MKIINKIINAAKAYLKKGISVIPCSRGKKPLVPSWKTYQNILMSIKDVLQIFVNATSIGIICGKISGNLETIDFDNPALFKLFMSTLMMLDPNLAKMLVIVKTPGGYHIYYRCEEAVEGNQNLANDFIEVEGPGKHPCEWRSGKMFPAIQIDGKWFITPTMIETRGEGGYAMSYPSPGYKPIKNCVEDPTTITKAKRDLLLTLARSYNNKPPQMTEPAKDKGRNSDTIYGGRPGDDFNKRADYRELLVSNGWSPTGKSGPGGEHWTRPGKDGNETSATLKFKHLYVFSSNAVMPAYTAHDAFSFYAWVNHGGDYKAAARELGKKGYDGNTIGVHDIEWSDPIPLPDSSSVTCDHEYPIEMLTEAVRKAAVEVSRFSKVPPASTGTIGLSCASVAIGNKAVVVERPGLKHYSSVFLALIAQSGARKSDPFKIMTAPLSRWSENGLEKYNQDKQAVIWHNTLLETAIAAQNAKAKKEGANLSAITKKILELESKKRAMPSDPYLFTSDTTEERLFQLMAEHGGAYAVMSGEGRPVIDGIMGRYSGAGRTGDATYLAGISGDTITRDRVSGVNGPESGRIIKPCLNVCIMLQPDKYLEAACCKTLRQSGALARMLPIFLPSMVGSRIEEVDEPGLNESKIATYNKMIETLLNAPHTDTPHEARLSKKAAEARRKYHNSLEVMMVNDGDLADVRDIASKATTQVAKLALILHLADNPKLLNRPTSIIRLQTWRRAEKLGRYHLKEAIRVQRQAIETEGIDTEYARRILDWVKSNNFDTITARKIQQGMPRPRGAAHEIKGALKVLIEHGYMQVRNSLYFVNPNSCAKQ